MVKGNQGSGLSRRKVVLGATAFAATAVGAAACAPGNTAQNPPPADVLANQKNATLEAWVHADTRSAWQMKTLEDYNKEKGANVTINWVKLSNTSDLANKLVVTTAAGSGFPDLADVEISQMGKLLKTPTPPLVAFNDHLKGKENDFFKPSFVDPWSLNGKYYGLGNELNVCLFAYRHDLFERAGIKAPIKTWDEVVDVGKRLAPHAPFGALLVSTGTTNTFHTLAIPAGGGYLEKGSKLTVNHTGNVKALQYLQDLVHRHKAASLEPSAEERKDAWTNGKVG
ncbi:MAG TPA: extracellular solute-binding protein, partial [Chloroflexota bacterium]|nr:extracellular solute-binding protein [Chloroflexota bacterium]